MATKSSGTPRKSSSSRKSAAKQPNTVTPISQGNGNSAEHVSTAQLSPEILEEIRVRAYEFYEERGRQEGFHDEDWARAEREIVSKYREKTA